MHSQTVVWTVNWPANELVADLVRNLETEHDYTADMTRLTCHEICLDCQWLLLTVINSVHTANRDLVLCLKQNCAVQCVHSCNSSLWLWGMVSLVCDLWPTTAVLSPMLVSGDCVPQRAEHASWRGHTAPLVTERSELPAPDYGTVFHHTWKTLTCPIANSGGRWSHFFLDSGATAQCELVLTAPSRNILTYLVTYLLTRSVSSVHMRVHIYCTSVFVEK